MKAIVMSGIAGSGKSTWASNYIKTHENYVVISTDSIRYELFESYVLQRDQEKLVQKTIMERIRQAASQRLNVIIDVAVVVNKNRINWYNRLREFYKEIDLVFIDTPLETCLSNNLKRDRHVPEDAIRFMNKIKQQPDEKVLNLFNNVYII